MKESLKNFVYEALDVFTNQRGITRKINGKRVRFPPRYSRYYESDYEPATFDFLRENCSEGDTFLDCGAHIGLFSAVAAQLVGESGRVFSFEPTPSTREILQKVVKINGCQKIVEVREEAISKKSGNAIFFDTGGVGSNANSLVQTHRHINELEVKTISIDDFVQTHCLQVKCIKIDVEGAEFDVLQGAAETIKNQRPAIHLGLHPAAIKEAGASLSEIWDFLQKLDLSVWYSKNPVNREWFTAQTEIIDVQCLPRKT